VTPNVPTGTVYHGTDATSAENLARDGLNRRAWESAAGGAGPDHKGFSVTTDRATAEDWARIRAGERGTSKGVVVEAEAGRLPLRPGQPGEWTDPNEWFIQPEDFPQVGPGVFTPVAEVDPYPGLSETSS
jgi:hypothetical protein